MYDIKDPFECPPEKESRYRLTDLGNGERLGNALAREYAYCPPLGGWMKETDGRYRLIGSEKVTKEAMMVVRRMADPKALRGLNPDEIRKLLDWQKHSERSTRLSAMVRMSKSLLTVESQVFDMDPLLINLDNGVYDLRNNHFRERTEEDRFTRKAAVEYDENAECPRWLQFLDVVFESDGELIRYLKKLCGYILTGKTSDQKFYNFLGSGANGKSTLLHVLRGILGDYAAVVPASALIERRRGDSASPELAKLRGIRFVITTEFNEDDVLNAARLKSLTGGEPISARNLYKRSFTYTPQFKIFIATNHPLNIQDQSHGMKRRIRVLPFDYRFSEQEQKDDYHEVLLRERSGILNWMLDGWRARRDGLNPPEKVVKRTEKYHQERDVLGRYLRDRTEERPGAKVLFKEMYSDYEYWFEGERTHIPSKSKLAERLRGRGVVMDNSTGNQLFVFGRELAGE